MGEYAGESIAKKITRARLYQRTRQMLDVMGVRPEERSIVFITGPNASEVGCIRHILEAAPQNVTGLDMDPKGIAALQEKMPGSFGVCGDLRKSETFNALLEIRTSSANSEKRSFVHLDLMGGLSADTRLIYGLYSLVAKTGSIVAMTYLRGRENGFRRDQLNEMKAVIPDISANLSGRVGRAIKRIVSPDPARAWIHIAELREHFAKSLLWFTSGLTEAQIEDILDTAIADEHNRYNIPVFYPIASYAYQGEVSPMGVVAAQLMPSAPPSDLYWDVYSQKSRFSSSVVQQHSMLDLLAEADSLSKHYDRQAVAEILDVAPGTLTAWQAHRTMGTYSI